MADTLISMDHNATRLANSERRKAAVRKTGRVAPLMEEVMSDIVERLRCGLLSTFVQHEAADEIESLRQQIAECKRALDVADEGRNYANELLSSVTKERDELVAALKLIQFADYKPVAKVASEALAKVGKGRQ